MASDINSVTLIGRLTRSPESKQAGGTSLAKLRIAFTSSKKIGDVWEDQPNYVDVTVFGRQADVISQRLDKGDRVAVQGRLAWREWTSQDGSKRQSLEIVAQSVQMLSPPKDGQDQQSRSGGPQNAAESSTDDIPF